LKVPKSWFSDYVNIDDISADTLASAMTMSGTMVEGVEKQGENIENVVVGKILKIEKHPDADKLVVCQVEIAPGEVVQIVTGATNVFEGAVIPVAKDGSTLPGGKIKKGKLRGVESCGMMCSTDELGISSERATGIYILPDDAPIGMDICEYLGINESILEFEITSNRPDCLSVIGLAREVAATLDIPFSNKKPEVKESGDDIKNYIDVEVKDSELCPRYTCRAVKNVKIEPSPLWLQKRLEDSGVRAINNIVDITNYVMLEYGQPMHAFDIRTLKGGKIIVRRAKDGEMLTTLDGVEHKLTSETLVIADAERAVALAGVMGGENSEIEDDTVTILFESANFNGASVRNSAKRAGLRTESSARFEKGLDVHTVMDALDRACELVNMLGAGEVVSGVIDVAAPFKPKKVLPLDTDYINGFLGTDISEEYMIKVLKSLDFEIDGKNIICPTFRADIEGLADIAEEVARIYGYNNIPSTLFAGETTIGGKNKKQRAEDLAANTLTALGFNEIMTYSFISPKVYKKLNIEQDDCIVISNPLGEDQSVMRTTAIGSALETLVFNYNRQNSEASVFEIATTYHKGGENGLAIEKQELVLASYGAGDYYDLKGAVEQLFDAFGIEKYDIVPVVDNPIFHPGQTAEISLRRKKCVTLGRIHPEVLENFGLEVPAYVAVIDFDFLRECQKEVKKYKHLPKFPKTTRDIAVIVPENVTVRSIEDIISRVKTNIIESYELFDVYQGKQVKEGHKSVAYSISFRASDRTLKDEEVNPVMDEIIKQLTDKLGAELRI